MLLTSRDREISEDAVLFVPMSRVGFEALSFGVVPEL